VKTIEIEAEYIERAGNVTVLSNNSCDVTFISRYYALLSWM
jgi:hypothetical protein